MVALGFTDSGFVGLPVMGLSVTSDGFKCHRWADLVDFVLGCGIYAVGPGGL